MRNFLRTAAGNALLSAVIGAVIWIVITFATGGTAAFALVGGILCGIVIFIIGYAFRRLFIQRYKQSPPA